MMKLAMYVHCTKLSAKFEFGGHSPWVQTAKNVALENDVGKISTECLVLPALVNVQVSAAYLLCIVLLSAQSICCTIYCLFVDICFFLFNIHFNLIFVCSCSYSGCVYAPVIVVFIRVHCVLTL